MEREVNTGIKILVKYTYYNKILQLIVHFYKLM